MAALSSTAVVLKAYADRQELHAPQGALVVAILLFQDVCLAPMLVLVPVLAGDSAASPANVVLAPRARRSARGRGVPGGAHRHAARSAARSCGRGCGRVFLLGALGVCLGMGMMTARAGLLDGARRLPGGAPAVGVGVRASGGGRGVAVPRSLQQSLLHLDRDVVRLRRGTHPWRRDAGLGLALVVLKTGIATAVFGLLGWPARIAVIGGMGLAQVGEFSFVLGAAGLQLGLLDTTTVPSFPGCFDRDPAWLTPLVVGVAPRVSHRAPRWQLPPAVRRRLPAGVTPSPKPMRPARITSCWWDTV